MKKLKLHYLLAAALFVNSAVCQPVSHIKKIENKHLIYLLCSTDKLISVSNSSIFINLFEVSNPYGSAHILGGDEVTNKFYIAISSIDDIPEKHLYSLGDFLAPQIIYFKEFDKNSFLLKIRYVKKGHSFISNYLIRLKNVTLIKDDRTIRTLKN